jgi:hypothetical protein
MKLVNRGFLIFADGEAYVKQAYLCAMSIRATKNEYPVSIVTCDEVPKEYTWAFDKIIDIPNYKKTDSRFRSEHRWKLYDVSPYEETIVLDADVLVLENLDYAWVIFTNYNLYYPTQVNTYRQEPVTNNYYRKAFIENKLPNVYNTLHFFKKCEECKVYYTWVEIISNNWEEFYNQHCKGYMPNGPSMDITCAIAAKILEIDLPGLDFPNIVHMKPAIQGWKEKTTNWTDRVGAYLTDDLKLKIGNTLQSTVFHYTEDEFVTDEMIRKYELCLSK